MGGPTSVVVDRYEQDSGSPLSREATFGVDPFESKKRQEPGRRGLEVMAYHHLLIVFDTLIVWPHHSVRKQYI